MANGNLDGPRKPLMECGGRRPVSYKFSGKQLTYTHVPTAYLIYTQCFGKIIGYSQEYSGIHIGSAPNQSHPLFVGLVARSCSDVLIEIRCGECL